MGRDKEKVNWLKGHPLEGDGTLANLFHYLWKKNKELESCPLVKVPDTVVYEHNFPRGWYCYDFKNEELKRKTGKELDTKTIYKEFSKPDGSGTDIVASYLSKSEDEESGEEITQVEFFNQQDLNSFLFKRERREQGILQKFIHPKGVYNSVIQAIWSPHVTLVERRNNTLKLSDRKFSMYERAVTYEGPAHYSTEVFCAPQLVEQIKSICQSIVNHFFSTEHKTISRMVLYFKVDAKNTVWLLWASSLRIADKLQINKNVPLNLSPKFTSPEEANTAHSATKSAERSSDSNNNDEPIRFVCPNCANTVDGERYEVPLEKVVGFFTRSPKKRSLSQSMRSRMFQDMSSPNSARSHVYSEAEYSPIANNGADTPSATTLIEQKPLTEEEIQVREEFKKQQSIIVDVLDDLLYEAYSHFLHSSSSFYFDMPHQLEDAFQSQLSELLSRLHIQKDGESERYFIPFQHISIGKLQREFQDFKDHAIQQLKMQLRSPTPTNEDEDLISIQLPNETFKERLRKSIQGGSVPGSPVTPYASTSLSTPVKQQENNDNERSDQVPAVIKKFLPDLTNQSYRYLAQEPLFLNRNIEMCENCFLQFTEFEP